VRHSTPLVSVITRKGGKVVTIPLAPRTARAIDLAIGERAGGPVFLAGDGRRLDRHGAGRIVRKVARRTGIGKAVTPHTLRHAFITAARSWMPGYRCGTCKRRRRTRIRGPRSARAGPRQPGPARDLHRGRLRRGCRPVIREGWDSSAWRLWQSGGRSRPYLVTNRGLNLSANRRYARFHRSCCGRHEQCRSGYSAWWPGGVAGAAAMMTLALVCPWTRQAISS
jgi:hypothetical protein